MDSNHAERLRKIRSGDFLEYTAYFAGGSVASLSEFDGITSLAEAKERARKISITEPFRGSVVSVVKTNFPD